MIVIPHQRLYHGFFAPCEPCRPFLPPFPPSRGGVVGVAGGCCSTSVGASISIGCSDVVGSCCVGVGNVDGVYAGSFWLPIVVFFLLAFFDGLSSLVS